MEECLGAKSIDPVDALERRAELAVGIDTPHPRVGGCCQTAVDASAHQRPSYIYNKVGQQFVGKVFDNAFEGLCRGVGQRFGEYGDELSKGGENVFGKTDVAISNDNHRAFCSKEYLVSYVGLQCCWHDEIHWTILKVNILHHAALGDVGQRNVDMHRSEVAGTEGLADESVVIAVVVA